jgi:hypothetical protein
MHKVDKHKITMLWFKPMWYRAAIYMLYAACRQLLVSLDLCDPKRYRPVDMLAVLILYNWAYIIIIIIYRNWMYVVWCSVT